MFALNNWRLRPCGNWHWPSEVAVVTGGCGGIGKQLVLGLREKDVKVVILDLLPLSAEFEGESSILYIKTDITSVEAIAIAAERIRKTFGPPSILINSAGLATPHSILDTPPGYLSKIFGRDAYMALPSMVDSCASKAAGLTFHEGLNSELKTKYKVDGVITTIVQPSWVRTPMSQDNADDIERAQGKMLTPEEVAEAVLAHIWSRRGGQVILPKGSTFFTTLQGWPNWAQELLRDMMGRAI
ncbi:hypothetical protein F5X68DRAFT_223372 [Plectosphaerella plurivora]|uniref:NAD(P)-binding protein n=1 Tax=Plectosphaerella plurivora TaxID=936078 RepID=A0A9P8V8P4_9PEZI|nr:hypothetical protein F5X68DRAFT_223372 [Plectosphaerella plurivora]